ncbi:MAG TPA: secondary thiamine-phosphate synthase enzyme YjbQ [Spirochaetota bacterium]|nr:secondary thiamine-phosphate synthase enzyme YjbQ [Spirochaetota bacterium]
MKIISVKSVSTEEFIDITGQVMAAVKELNIGEGLCCIYTPHTTAAVTINENADPSVKRDILAGLRSLNFENVHYLHAEGNSPAHIKSSLVGASEMVIIDKGKLQLGTWQGIYFCEFDGPRSRKVYVSVS